jgi:hypothetical protein
MSSESWRRYVIPEPERLKPKRHRGALVNYGPRELRLQETVIYEGGPDAFVQANPQLFATGTTSNDEGYAYWALLKIIGPEREIGKNGMTWYYQSKVGGGSNRPGGSIVDFVVEGTGPNKDIGIRIVTPFFHEQAGAFKRATDEEQRFSLLDNDIFVVDVNSRNYITDKSGAAVLREMRNAIEMREGFNPLFRHWGPS